MPAQVLVRELSKHYGRVEAVRKVSFAVEAGEVFGLLGANGAGKTTTVECLIGLREPDEGQIEIGGFDVRRNPREVKERLGVALQSTALQDKITPREALTLLGRFYSRRVEPADLLQRFALTHRADVRFDSLSGGEQQRLALALALVNRPEIVLLDEPTSGLDVQSRRELHAAIEQMKAEGRSVLLTTHYLEEAERLCDRVAVIDRGRIVAMGTPRELIAQSAAPQSVSLRAGQPLDRAALLRLPGIEELECEESLARFRTRRATETLAALTQFLAEHRIAIVELEMKQASLEDVFLSLTHSANR